MSSGLDLPRAPLAPIGFPELPQVGGVEFATHGLGLYKGRVRDDLLVAHFPNGASVGGVFTMSSTRSADVDWCREALREGEGRASVLVVNAGNSNAFTGEAGVEKNRATVLAATELSGCAPHEVFLSATGVIGEPLAPHVVSDGVKAAWPRLARPDWKRVSNAIRTTDTYEKAAGEIANLNRRNVAIAGFCKGSGMIAPNMATMLAYVFTDANLGPDCVQTLLSRYCDLTFNCVTVDGDTSTSDTLLLFATGAAGGEPIDDADDPRLEEFRQALHRVMHDLAIQVVADGEGATKLIEIEVTSGASDASAKAVACAIANSPLVKTAIAAGDANWGRVVMAVGKSGEPVERDKMTIHFGNHLVGANGARAASYSEAAATAAVKGPKIEIKVDLGVGRGQAKVWTCDLTDGYVKINGAYRS
jgi:glutamate N-acetyltransferase/amino-acid N-acetyltransferase